jgi:hypothetical protein
MIKDKFFTEAYYTGATPTHTSYYSYDVQGNGIAWCKIINCLALPLNAIKRQTTATIW